MADAVKTIGDPTTLQFSIRWDESHGGDRAENRTQGELCAVVGRRVVWGSRTASSDRGLSWTWIELLEHLAESWRYLAWEESDPIGLLPGPIELLRSQAEQRWDDLPANLREVEEGPFYEFEQAHNLAAGLHGMWVPALWMLRQGNLMYVSGARKRVREPVHEILAILESLGAEICARLHGSSDARSKAALEAWADRESATPREFAAIQTGLDPAFLESVAGKREFRTAWELDSLEPNELLAAARMVGPGVPPAAMRTILKRIQRVKPRKLAALDNLSARIRAAANPDVGSSHDQGRRAAAEVRVELGNPSGRMDPEALLKKLGVLVADVKLTGAPLDAVSCWGPRHGPAILVNTAGPHAQERRGRRATFAHELCHLLLDRESALPLAEVLGGRTPVYTERRARKFSAELLVPERIAGHAFVEGKDPRKVLDSLCRRFIASREVVAWQARNSGELLSRKTLDFLRTQVSAPERF